MCQYEYCILFYFWLYLSWIPFLVVVFDFISKLKTFVFSIDKRH